MMSLALFSKLNDSGTGYTGAARTMLGLFWTLGLVDGNRPNSLLRVNRTRERERG